MNMGYVNLGLILYTNMVVRFLDQQVNLDTFLVCP